MAARAERKAVVEVSKVKDRKKRRGKVKEVQLTIIVDPVESAQAAGLRYVTDRDPGIRRRRAGRGFSYSDPDSKPIRDRATLGRIKALGIPPAWESVWISPIPQGHLQATGRDARGRKQYIYHPLWRTVRDQTKFNRMVPFGNALPSIRERTQRDLALSGLARERVLATVVRLLETTLIRIGNQEYARDNDSFGLTTLRESHLDVSGSILRFQFRGKSGKEHTIEVNDRRVAKVVKKCLHIPGHELFHYIDDEGQVRKVDSADVNDYLREITGEDFTAKEFRTWGGTMHTAYELSDIGPFETATAAKKNIVEAVKRVSCHLGNKPSVCRKYYIHPAIIDAYLDGRLLSAMQCAADEERDATGCGLQPEERAVLEILKEHDLVELQSSQSMAV